MSKQRIVSEHRSDANGNPAGGNTASLGLAIIWQSGPTRGPGGEQNGAFVETAIDAVIDRLNHYQTTKFACIHNRQALEHLNAALQILADRSAMRRSHGVEGLHVTTPVEGLTQPAAVPPPNEPGFEYVSAHGSPPAETPAESLSSRAPDSKGVHIPLFVNFAWIISGVIVALPALVVRVHRLADDMPRLDLAVFFPRSGESCVGYKEVSFNQHRSECTWSFRD